MTVAMASPSIPKFSYNAINDHDKRPVGPPICTLQPPKKGDNESTDNSRDQSFLRTYPGGDTKRWRVVGATMPTIIPAMRSVMNLSLE